MKKKILKQRAIAVERYFAGEDPARICASLGKTTRWLYKWVSRHTPDEPAWFKDQSRRPLSSPYRTSAEIERIVELVRLNLYNKGDFCGNQAIQWELADMEVQPVPSLSTIGRILRRRCPIRPIRLIWSALVILPARSSFTACMPSIPQSTSVG